MEQHLFKTEKKSQATILYPAKTFFRIKVFSDIKMLKEFISRRTALQEKLKRSTFREKKEK